MVSLHLGFFLHLVNLVLGYLILGHRCKAKSMAKYLKLCFTPVTDTLVPIFFTTVFYDIFKYSHIMALKKPRHIWAAVDIFLEFW